MKEYPLIELPGLDAIEAEKGEVLVNPSSVTFAIGGKTHARGGTKMLAEAGSYILSDHLKLDADVVDTLIGVKKKMSPAKLSKMYDTQKWADILESKDKRYDQLAKNTAAMMFAKNSARQGMIYQAQEQLKAKKGMKNDLENAMSKSSFSTGGKVKYQNAGATPNSPYSNEYLDEMNRFRVGPGPVGMDQFGNFSPMTNEDYFLQEGLVRQSGAKPMALKNPGNKTVDPNYSFTPPTAGIPGAGGDYTSAPGMFSGMFQGKGTNSIENGQLVARSTPLGDDPYWGVRDNTLGKNGSQLSPETAKILGNWQSRISNIRSEFPGTEGKQMEEYIGKALREADKVSSDKYLQKFVVMPNGSEIPLSGATDAQISASKNLRFLNTKTGKADLVDLKDYENQNINPMFESRGSLGDFRTAGQGIVGGKAKLSLPVTPAQAEAIQAQATTAPVAAVPGEIKKGVDWQSIVNGTQIGLMAADLATTRTKPPYYDYASSEIAYTRFEPINTKQQERAFNIARQSIENSNLPQQVKQAQLSNMYGSMAEGVNQVDITNYQNKLANDNRNVQSFNQARNTDILRQQGSNLRYAQEADRRNYMASAQRQEYLNGIMDTWSKHVANRRDVRLVNQVANNYDYNFNTEQVEYMPGQGTKPNSNRLGAFGTQPPVPLQYLTAEGRKALGY